MFVMGFGASALWSSLIILVSYIWVGISALSMNHYDKTCPNVESIVAKAVSDATSRDNTVPATLLRMHFHDCFIRGCDGSVLLESRGGNKAERDAPPNKSLHAFYVIESAKKAVEAVCPAVVSCADILAFAARDAVVLSGGPRWDVPQGRKDGRTSKASETSTLPSPAFNNISQLKKAFSLRGLSLRDAVALTGAHTLGFAHCSSFEKRIHSFNSTHDVDPTIRPSFAATLKSACPLNNKARNAGIAMDPSPTTFDTTHYKLVIQRKALFASDQTLLTAPQTKSLVYKFATSKRAFHTAFAKSMIKMSSLNGGQEIRKDCRFVN